MPGALREPGPGHRPRAARRCPPNCAPGCTSWPVRPAGRRRARRSCWRARGAGRRRPRTTPSRADRIGRLCGGLPLALRVAGSVARRHVRRGRAGRGPRARTARCNPVERALWLRYTDQPEPGRRLLRRLALAGRASLGAAAAAALLATDEQEAARQLDGAGRGRADRPRPRQPLPPARPGPRLRRRPAARRGGARRERAAAQERLIRQLRRARRLGDPAGRRARRRPAPAGSGSTASPPWTRRCAGWTTSRASSRRRCGTPRASTRPPCRRCWARCATTACCAATSTGWARSASWRRRSRARSAVRARTRTSCWCARCSGVPASRPGSSASWTRPGPP